jgi:hypothetical protein
MSHDTAGTLSSPRPIDWLRIGGWAGILFVAAFAVAAIFALAPAPAGGADAEVIRQWARDQATVYLTFMWLSTVMHLVFLLPFAGGLAVLLGRGDRVLGWLVLAGAAGSALTSTVGTAFSAALTLGSAAELSDASVTAFWRADNFVFLLVLSAFQALMVGAAGVAILRDREMPRWLGALGLLVAFALLVDGLWVVGGEFTGVFEVLWFGGLIGFAVWIVAASVWMIRHSGDVDPT